MKPIIIVMPASVLTQWSRGKRDDKKIHHWQNSANGVELEQRFITEKTGRVLYPTAKREDVKYSSHRMKHLGE